MKTTANPKRTESLIKHRAGRTPQGVTPVIAAKLSPGRCGSKTTAGKRCQARKLIGSDHCFFHDPRRKADRIKASAAGGKSGAQHVLPCDSTDLSVKSAGDVESLLVLTINQVRKGLLDSRIANAVGYLATVLLRAREQGTVEERLNALEKMVEGSRRLPS